MLAEIVVDLEVIFVPVFRLREGREVVVAGGARPPGVRKRIKADKSRSHRIPKGFRYHIAREWQADGVCAGASCSGWIENIAEIGRLAVEVAGAKLCGGD